MQEFDVGLMREMMARQQADAGRIVMLCDALENTAKENSKLRAQLAATPTPKEDHHDRKE